MLNYWEMLNAWSTRSNITVSYKRAFDIDDAGFYRDNGWWLLDNTGSQASEARYQYIEKKACKYIVNIYTFFIPFDGI